MKRLSIVTVVLNNVCGIKKTIESVLDQENEEYEYIIVDGGSSDGTLEVIKKYEIDFKQRGIDYLFYSQIDKGVYDAMNKALGYICGKYIIYMNSGDTFSHKEVLGRVICHLNGKSDVVYGNTICEKGGWQWLQMAGEPEEIIEKTPFCHQSVFTKTEIVKKYKFNTMYKICADYDMYLRMYLDGLKFERIDVTVARFVFDGISSVDRGRPVLLENVDVRYENGVLSKWDVVRHKRAIEKEYRCNTIKLLIKNIIPPVVLNMLNERRYIKRGWTKISP